jgi:hypothetical protein
MAAPGVLDRLYADLGVVSDGVVAASSSAAPPTLDVAAVRRLWDQSLTSGTQTKYAAIVQRVCAEYGIAPPFTVRDILHFVSQASLRHKPIKPSTMFSYMSALARVNNDVGAPNVFDTYPVRTVLTGYKKAFALHFKDRLHTARRAFDPHIIHHLLHLDPVQHDDFTMSVLVAFFLMLRVASLSSFTVADVMPLHNNAVLIRILDEKTAKSDPVPRELVCNNARDSRFLQLLLCWAAKFSRSPSAPLFRDRTGQPMSAEALTAEMPSLLSRLGEPPHPSHPYTAASLRPGGATAAYLTFGHFHVIERVANWQCEKTIRLYLKSATPHPPASVQREFRLLYVS